MLSYIIKTMGSLKSIYELVTGNYKFVIPSYQRGYRWTERETQDLLEDVLDFMRKPQLEEKTESFYCLQPLVVKRDESKGENVYRVIDGQQRLTTILLILQALKNEIGIHLENIFGISSFYEIDYEVRDHSTSFLKSICINGKAKEQAFNNIDFWHMYNNYYIIVQWLESLPERTENRINACDFANTLLKRERNVRFIWYEVSEEDEIQLFTRLNIGKIPLTNSELIKALFLLSLENEDEKALLINEWDSIETKLQDNRFWGFIYSENSYKKPTRIDILFDLVADDENIEEVKEAQERFSDLRKDDERRSFYIFYEALRNKDKESQQRIIKEIWHRVKYYFRILEEFYEDNELYHLVGYLINVKDRLELSRVVKTFQGKDRKEFKEFLREKIKEKLGVSKTELRELSYSEDKDKKKIEKVLFLFNVVLAMNANKNLEDNMYLRFPFHLHKSQKWNLEHINPRNPENLQKEEMIKLLEEYLKDVEIEEGLKNDIKEALSTKEKEEIEKVLNKLFEKYSPNEEEKDYIGNLTLLSEELNKKLQNYFFYKKREIIMEEEKKGTYIPLGTKYVFMKYPLEGSKLLVVWDKSDMEEYLNFIEETLKDFLKEETDEQQ